MARVSLDSKLTQGNSLPYFLQRRIHFKEAIIQDDPSTSNYSYTQNTRKRKAPVVDEDGFKSPSYELFAREKLSTLMNWSRVMSVGPGLQNLGNTCFLNSVLQCLTYTPPLANYLLNGDHSKKCKVEGFCMMCDLERHLKRSFGSNITRYISPNSIVGNLKSIAKHMRLGRQEDSHEFLRFVIEGIQKSLLFGLDVKNMDPRVKETTFIHNVFGGYLQSQVKCHSCQFASKTFDAFLDLSLDIRQSDSIERALRQYVQPERLSKSNKYRCDHCQKLSDADKSMSIFRSPNVLTLHLKRFQMSPFGEMSKLNKFVEFSPELDLSEFISDSSSKRGESQRYSLYSVLVHEGQSCNSGHYHAFVKSSNGIWYSMNDSSVHQVGLSTVLKQRAYLLFYIKQQQQQKQDYSFEEPKKQQKSLVSDSKPPKSVSPELVDLPTPPSTPDPLVQVEETTIISNSMWHLSETNKSKSPVFKNNIQRRSRPKSSWKIRKLKLY